MKAEPWASVDAVAKHLGAAKDSAYLWIASRNLPARKIGRLREFKFSKVDERVRAARFDTAHEGGGQ